MLDLIINHPSQSLEKIFLAGDTEVLRIGSHSYTGNIRLCIYDGAQSIKIGKFCSIANDVEFTLVADHTLSTISTFPFEVVFPDMAEEVHSLAKQAGIDRPEKRNISIGNDVWIGRGAKILTGVSIGNGAVIGSECVVSKDVPPYSVVVGNPLKIIRFRFADSDIQALQEICWWDWPLSRIKANLINIYSTDVASLRVSL